MSKKKRIGFFSFSCCQGCQFTVLFIPKILDLLKDFDIQYFHLLKEKNRETKFDVAFIEGAITSKKEIRKLKEIRNKSKLLIVIGACAAHGGIPAMRNFLEKKSLKKYVYDQNILDKTVKTAPISKYVKVDHTLYGCPIIKKEFISLIDNLKKDSLPKTKVSPVCAECPRRAKNCFLKEKKMCLGAVTRGGCDAICLHKNIPCVLCRGPLDPTHVAKEVKLFKSWGYSENDIKNRIKRFTNG